MAFPLYLALTPTEILHTFPLPQPYGWMACHYGSYTDGISNVPTELPPNSMLIFDDQIPPSGHDPKRIAQELFHLTEALQPACVLLDFQRQDLQKNADTAAEIAGTLTCSVGVSALYASPLSCPVFLPPPPLHIPISEYLAPWQGREIWLDVALDCACITVTKEGSHIGAGQYPAFAQPSFEEPKLHCGYSMDITEDRAIFTLWRTRRHLETLLQEAEAFGVTKAVGLYQELGWE